MGDHMKCHFSSLSDLSYELAIRTKEHFLLRNKGDNYFVKTSLSNTSCSSYVVLDVLVRDESEYDGFKVRFSDHPGGYGSDHTIRFEKNIDVVLDEFGEFDSIQIEGYKFNDMVDEAIDALEKGMSEILFEDKKISL